MSSIQNILNRSKDIRSLCSRFTSLSFTAKPQAHHKILCSQNTSPLKLCVANIHSTLPRYDLMEFFDDKKNWGANEVRCGRSWTKDELRIKSNSDLHKLWYVLIKERNMLLTMEHECNEEYELFPSPERLDKVKESMENLETVVRERNKAYYMLETGTDGERPASMQTGRLGLRYLYRAREHFIPEKFNKKYNRHTRFLNEYLPDGDLNTFLSFYREKLYKKKLKARRRDKNHVKKLLVRFPHLNRGLLRKLYPDVSVDKIDYDDRARGHFAPKID